MPQFKKRDEVKPLIALNGVPKGLRWWVRASRMRSVGTINQITEYVIIPGGYTCDLEIPRGFNCKDGWVVDERDLELVPEGTYPPITI